MTKEETAKELIIQVVESILPEFAKAAKSTDNEIILLTQDAFASSETTLLGSAIKYAGYYKKTVQII